MKQLQIYKDLKLSNEEEVFDYLINTLSSSIFTWDFFTDFEKVKKNVKKIEKELNLMNYLIGKENLEEEFISLVKEYPKVRKTLPILIAVRDNKLNELNIIDDFEELISENKKILFDINADLNDELKKDILVFFKETGLKDLFENKHIKNIVDYCMGVEVGMDTNARKNRTGTSMERIVEVIIENFSSENDLEFISQATQKKIKDKWNFEIQIDKSNRIFDFAIFNKKSNKLYLLETNYYGGGGSKLKATAGEYQYVHNFLKNQNIDLIWITDGLGWNTTKKGLYETFVHNDYVFNLELIKKGVLKEIIFNDL
ncbi:MAG: type II restriction endonuclease [Candidatus Woesearchaeota archaeon]